MYIHIGGETVIPKKHLVAIINLPADYETEINTEFLKLAVAEGRMKDKEDEKYKSCIITNEKVYLSTISANTLTKRAKNTKFTLSDWKGKAVAR